MLLATISLIGALFIVLVYIRFPSLRTDEYRLVFYLALSDIGLMLGYLIGSPKEEDEIKKCAVQGFLINCFAYSSVLWAAQISRILYLDTVRKLPRDRIFNENLSW